MKKIKSQKGQALILIALAIVGLVGFTALTIDGGRVLADRRHAQNAADTAALAAALAHIQAKSNQVQLAIDAAMFRAASNGYDNGDDSDVVVNIPPVSGPYAGDPQYIQVIIKSYVPTTFARVLGRTQVENTVEAITRVQGSTSMGTFFGGAGMVATRSDSQEKCFELLGNANVVLHDTGIFVNCLSNNSIFFNGGSTITLPANAVTAGGGINQGGNIVGPGIIQEDAPWENIDDEDFEDVPRALDKPTCPANVIVFKNGDTVLKPGTYNNNVSSNNSLTMEPGKYCFNQGLNINGQANLSGTGSVQMVLGSDLNLGGSANIFDGLEIYTENARLSLKGTLTAERLRFFATGTGGFDIQGPITCYNAYFYSYKGLIIWNSNAVVKLKAPPQGDTFGGLLVHQPWENTNAYILNGNTNSSITGTILVPHSKVTYNGGAGFVLHGQIIGYEFKIAGGGHTEIFYKADENYGTPSEPTIEITK